MVTCHIVIRADLPRRPPRGIETLLRDSCGHGPFFTEREVTSDNLWSVTWVEIKQAEQDVLVLRYYSSFGW
jgi:hypothetical protein